MFSGLIERTCSAKEKNVGEDREMGAGKRKLYTSYPV